MSNVVEANAAGWEHIKELTARITELETANKGLQIALLDASEKEKELQLCSAMLVDALSLFLQPCDCGSGLVPDRIYGDEDGEQVLCEQCEHSHFYSNNYGVDENIAVGVKALSATSVQSASWLENSHREWMKGLPVAVYGLPTVPVRYVGRPDSMQTTVAQFLSIAPSLKEIEK